MSTVPTIEALQVVADGRVEIFTGYPSKEILTVISSIIKATTLTTTQMY